MKATAISYDFISDYYMSRCHQICLIETQLSFYRLQRNHQRQRFTKFSKSYMELINIIFHSNY